METRVSSVAKEVVISSDQPTVLIGERIDPAGKKKLAEALKAGDMEMVRSEAIAQAEAGAGIMDVKISVFEILQYHQTQYSSWQCHREALPASVR
jgi:5-methyltetrahydrofolate--homocysteine methyltransferase